jgi:hypothetical protein
MNAELCRLISRAIASPYWRLIESQPFMLPIDFGDNLQQFLIDEGLKAYSVDLSTGQKL